MSFNVYAAISYNSELSQWVNLVLTENGALIMCLIYDSEEQCRYEMVEISKVRLNQFCGDHGRTDNPYDLIVVDKTDARFVEVRRLNAELDYRKSRIVLRAIDQFYAVRSKLWVTMLKIALIPLEWRLSLNS